jgi:hypothetical protein
MDKSGRNARRHAAEATVTAGYRPSAMELFEELRRNGTHKVLTVIMLQAVAKAMRVNIYGANDKASLLACEAFTTSHRVAGMHGWPRVELND